MSGLFFYRASGSAPAGADFTIAGGQETTPGREVTLIVSSRDHIVGANNVSDVKVWGDIQPDSNTYMATTEGNADWFRFSPEIDVVLSAGAGTKTINVQIRNAAMMVTDTITRTIDLLDGTPEVAILWRTDRRTIRSASLGSVFSIAWSSSHDYDAYEVRSVTNMNATRDEGTLVSSGGSGTAGTVVTSSIDTDDYTLSTGTGVMMGKVFVSVGGSWYS